MQDELKQCFLFLFLPVCETKFRQYDVSDQSANCTVVSENVCFNDTAVDGTVKQVCRDVPKTVCDVNTNNINKGFPETEVQL
jgi:hypothetical protein